MDAQVINFKRYDSGAMVGFFDLAVAGITVTGCKAFRKRAEDGADKLWFSWPAEKTQDRDGKDYWREIVTAAEPVMRHLQSLVRGQLRNLLDAGGNGSGRKPAAGRAPQKCFRTPEGEDLSDYRSNPNDDIPF